MAYNLGVAKTFGGIVAPEIGPKSFRTFEKLAPGLKFNPRISD